MEGLGTTLDKNQQTGIYTVHSGVYTVHSVHTPPIPTPSPIPPKTLYSHWSMIQVNTIRLFVEVLRKLGILTLSATGLQILPFSGTVQFQQNFRQGSLYS